MMKSILPFFFAALPIALAQDLSDPTRPLGSVDVKVPDSAPKAAAPRLPNGQPDLSGIWSPDRNFIYDISDALKPGEDLPLQPWAAKLARERMSKDDPEANCLPTGVPRLAPYPWNIVQTPKYTYFLFEGNIHSFRQIFMDGRKHSDDPNPTWYGESIGHWEGDTLAVDTTGFNELFWFDFAGHPHTAKLHVVEKYQRPDVGHLNWETTIDDPGAYTRPFTLYGHSILQNTDLMEYICQENNKDVSHILGKDPRNRDSKNAGQR
jgi:hypothetical protein